MSAQRYFLFKQIIIDDNKSAFHKKLTSTITTRKPRNPNTHIYPAHYSPDLSLIFPTTHSRHHPISPTSIHRPLTTNRASKPSKQSQESRKFEAFVLAICDGRAWIFATTTLAPPRGGVQGLSQGFGAPEGCGARVDADFVPSIVPGRVCPTREMIPSVGNI